MKDAGIVQLGPVVRPAPLLANPAMFKILTPLLLALLSGSTFGQADSATPGDLGFEWNARTAEHLINRAGFGARPEDVDRAVEMGFEAFLETLFLPLSEQVPLKAATRKTKKDGVATEEGRRMEEAGGKEMASEEMLNAANDADRELRKADRTQLEDYTLWWFDTMISGQDPLRDRMTLFWHGMFTSSMQDVKSSYQMIKQNQLLRNGALGNYSGLLMEVAKDPAMLEYLDNDENKKSAPNENFAREVMELFTLGEGNYSEDDIKEAARAFTGWRSKEAEFSYIRRQHDNGTKTFLGVTGKLKGEDVLEILLEQPACGEYVAARILNYLEGVPPSAERKTQYGALFSSSGYDVELLLRELFQDPAFYRDEIVGNRVMGPVDFLVGSARRLDVMPPRAWLLSGSQLLGQRLFHPPSVKGWDGGMTWITTASLMQRGNLAGLLVGQIAVEDVLSSDLPEYQMEDGEEMGGEVEDRDAKRKVGKLGELGGLKKIQGRWHPMLHLSGGAARAGARSDAEVVDYLMGLLLAVEAGSDTRDWLVSQYVQMRGEAGLARQRGRMQDRREGEDVLASMAHLILSLPEAQLN